MLHQAISEHDFMGKVLNDLDAKNDIILDFFSGSASVAHATMKLNAEENTSRKHIQVQLCWFLTIKCF